MYHYFADKNDLVAAVIDLQSDEVLGAQQVGLEQVDTIAPASWLIARNGWR